MKILAGDIGGTKVILAIFEKRDDRLHLLEQAQFASGEYADFADLVAAFWEKRGSHEINAAVFGIAGPVIGGVCHTTNLPWVIETEALREQLGTQRVKLLNDLEATAYGMLFLKEDQFVSLNPEAQPAKANRAVIAAGTGLGEAILYRDDKGAFHPMGTEGGHTDFAPVTPQQDRLLHWLRSHYPSHVSVERVLSGPGIYTIYRFLAESGFAPEPSFMTALPEGADPSAMVSEGALEYKDKLCIETLRLFTEIYGQEAGNLVLKSLALGGLYVGGGIAPKILEFMKEESFMKAFVHKGRFEKLLRQVDVKVSLEPETALMGAARYAADKFDY